MGLKADEIYQKMSQADASSLDMAKASAQSAAAHYSDLEQQVRELSQMIAAGWQGNAAQAAQAGTTPLSTMVASAHGELAIHQKALADQQEAVNTVKGAVQPVPAEPPHNNLLNEMTPWHTDLDTQIDNYNNTANANTAAYNTYVQSSSSNGSAMPSSFPGVAPDGSNVTVTAPDQGGGTSGGWSGTPYAGAGGGTTRTSSAGWGGSPRAGGSAAPIGGWTGSPGAGSLRTDAAQWAGGPNVGGPGGGPASWGPNTGGPGGPGENPAAFGPFGGGPLGGVGEPEGGFGGRGGAGSARFGAGAGAGGAGSSGRGAPGAGNTMGAQEEAMGRAAAARGMAGAAGARGAAGGPMGMGGRGGKGEEDGEHRSASYLVGDRSSELAGDLPLTAPPVIGE
ncbi:hypothetical protein [Gandjariella thermophila]|uniref:PPE family domain-containing protein n=1 Tax=Gandjariella thermophila TaxID=1931992 RepID=A0A4D4J9Z7_9PSEU|nr:hypothetical protein [Gandjariella thermophila]GDY30653.1 hypothetical protein GTS_22860 [Gandjariella thermophila]